MTNFYPYLAGRDEREILIGGADAAGEKRNFFQSFLYLSRWITELKAVLVDHNIMADIVQNS